MQLKSLSEQKHELLSFLHQRENSNAQDPCIVVSPYRICPLGAHIDHQGGPVLGMTIHAGSVLAFVPTNEPRVRLHSMNYDVVVDFPLGNLENSLRTDWGRYAKGAAKVLNGTRPLRKGLIGAVSGALPEGGLSSSASVGLAYLYALARANGIEHSEDEFVELDRRLENDYLGLQNGILDPASIVHGKQGKLLYIDTVKRHVEPLDTPAAASGFRILIVHSGVPRNLTKGSGYNDRVGECREAAKRLGERAGMNGVGVLGDVPVEVFEHFGHELSPGNRLRAAHFYSEVERVKDGVRAWRKGDWEAFGSLMNQSCGSSLTQYQCGCVELEKLQEIVSTTAGVYGSRFSGAGFGGCLVALVRRDFSEDAAAGILRQYTDAYPQFEASAGVHLTDSDHGVRFQ